MLNVPSVTMNAGRASRVTRAPLRKPNAAQARIPSRIASTGGTLLSTAILVMTIEPKAMTVPHDRSMPAVRMISVWPMASVPITITCWMISEKFSVVRNRDDCVQKKRQAMSSANNGPSWASRSRRDLRQAAASALRRRRRRPSRGAGAGGLRFRLGHRLAPAVLLAVGGVLGLDSVHRLVGDQVHAGVDVARRLRRRRLRP